MIARVLLWGVLIVLVLRAIFRFFGGLIEGGSSQSTSKPRSPDRGEMMSRDPVCGTFVVPSKALSIRDPRGTHYFCSEKCRDAFLAR
ncbi:MAG: hypothetical protein AB1806_05180 [Acidobacteriota bacterium]